MPEVTIEKEKYRIMLQDGTVSDFLVDNGFDFNGKTKEQTIHRTEEFGKITFKQETK